MKIVSGLDICHKYPRDLKKTKRQGQDLNRKSSVHFEMKTSLFREEIGSDLHF